MDKSQEGSSRRQWEIFSGEIQEDVNATLEELTLEIEVINEVLVKKYREEADDFVQYVSNAIEYLEDKWGYINDQFMISGKWYEPMVGLNDEGIMVRHQKKDAFNVVSSNGFRLKVLDEDEGGMPNIGMSFVATQASHMTATVEGDFRILAFANPSEISLQYMRPGDLSVVSSSVEEVSRSLLQADSLLYLYMNHHGSEFYRQGAKKQELFIRSVLQSVEDVLPAPETFDTVMLHNASTSVLVFKNPAEKGVTHLQSKTSANPFVISGKVIGVTLVDVVNDGYGKKYSNPDETWSAGAGISLIVEPKSVNFELDACKGYDLLVPLRALDSLNLSVV